MSTTNTITTEAQEYCKNYLNNLANKYNFTYTLAFNSKFSRVLGRCNRYKNRANYGYITINSNYLLKYWEIGNLEHVEQTLKHEVAHLLTAGHGHDRVWKEKLIELGGLPLTHSTQKEYKPYRYVYECPCCHKQLKRVKKISKSMKTACGKCCKEFNNGKWSEKYMFQIVEDKGRVIS